MLNDEIVNAIEHLYVKDKKIKHIHVIGIAKNMETWSCVQQMRGILFEHAGIPHEDIDSEKYKYCGMTQFPCEVKICEPVVFVFEDDFRIMPVRAEKIDFCSFDGYYMDPTDRLPDEVIIESNRDVAVSFYRRFTARMRAMMTHSPQYALITFEGP